MADLKIERKSVLCLFSEMQDKKFVIPDYQRQYEWDEEKCDILWSDITNYFLENDNLDNDNKEYFLGSIVTCIENADDKKNISVIDGQQRIISLSLLLRAFYKKLQSMDEDGNIIGLKTKIEPCLWDVDKISGRVTDFSKIHIESRVVVAEDNEIFHSILNSGECNYKRNNLYSTNYSFFFTKCGDFAKDNPTKWQPLCVNILSKCVVFPIECNELDTALTIFSTLNDRGLPLCDSDIFKAQLYKMKNNEERIDFSRQWKELSEKTKSAKLSLTDLFRYYSHFIRAKEGDKTKEIGLRQFFAHNKYSRLNSDKDLMKYLFDLADFWYAINNRASKISENVKEGQITPEAMKYLHCLKVYPNEYWRYIVSTYYLKSKCLDKFTTEFPLFLKKLTAFLFVKFIIKPTVNAIKDDIYQGYIDVYKGEVFPFKGILDRKLYDEIKSSISGTSSWKISRGLLLLHAYQNERQIELIPDNFEIEHIFPIKWQATNYNGWGKDDAIEYLEKYGNKVVIEKKVNIQAGNEYFGLKKEHYRDKSRIAEVLELSKYEKNDWTKVDIEEREQMFVKKIVSFFEVNLQE